MVLTKSRNTVATILRAAEDLFLTRNYADVTMDKIAQAAEVTKGALYHHFSGKEALYLAMMGADLSEKREIFRQAVESAGSARERLGRLMRAFFDLPPGKRELIRLVRRDVNVFGDTVRSEFVRAYQKALPEQVESIVRDGIREGEIGPGDSRLLSWYYAALVEVTLSRHADRALLDTESKVNHVLDLFFCGAAATPTGEKE